MTGVRRLGKKAQIGQSQNADCLSPLTNQFSVDPPADCCIDEHQAEEEDTHKQNAKKYI